MHLCMQKGAILGQLGWVSLLVPLAELERQQGASREQWQAPVCMPALYPFRVSASKLAPAISTASEQALDMSPG